MDVKVMTDAQRTAADIAVDVQALEHLLSGVDGPAVDDDIAERADQMVSDYSDGDDYSGDYTVSAYINGVLDVEIDGRYLANLNFWDVRQVALLVGFGGPTSRIISNGGDDVAVVVNWWNDNANVTVYAPRLAAIIFGLADDLSGAN